MKIPGILKISNSKSLGGGMKCKTNKKPSVFNKVQSLQIEFTSQQFNCIRICSGLLPNLCRQQIQVKQKVQEIKSKGTSECRRH